VLAYLLVALNAEDHTYYSMQVPQPSWSMWQSASQPSTVIWSRKSRCVWVLTRHVCRSSSGLLLTYVTLYFSSTFVTC
jgi:hypothetical protein